MTSPDSIDEQTVLNQHTPYYFTLTSVDSTQSINMTRSHKFNDKDHAGLADGTAAPEEHLPRYFAKSGHVGEDPKKTKKNGGGKANWGNPGEEILDDHFNFANSRRRSNSSGFHNIHDFKTKFEVNEPEPVFEETIHGPADDELTKTESSSTSGGSIDEMPAKSV